MNRSQVTVARAVALIACLGLLSLSPAAHAQKNCGGNTVPPGNSEVDQYTETVPDGCGDSPLGSPEGGNPDAVPPATAQDLASLGDDGAAALALARASAPGGGDRKGGDSAGATGAGSGDSDDGFGDIPAGVLDAAGGSSGDGLGVLFPLLLLAAALAGGAYVLRRRNAG